ncbi:MAG: ribonuclease P protein component [Bacteroidia bacterium]|nr:ribonuclease P protein component [Bacteroidia bacterium]
MNTRTETFQKSERLCSRKIISLLFDEGDIFYTPLFKIVWSVSPSPSPFPARVAFSVVKRGFRKAVDRNLLKRRMREAYRHEKTRLYEMLNSLNTRISFIIIFRGNRIPDYQEIKKSMEEMIEKLFVAAREKQKNC